MVGDSICGKLTHLVVLFGHEIIVSRVWVDAPLCLHPEPASRKIPAVCALNGAKSGET